MTPDQFEKFKELQRLLDEMYQHWRDNAPDHHCKSSEGAVKVGYPNWFEQQPDRDGTPGKDPLKADRVWVFSYVMGPNRGHDFFGFSRPCYVQRQSGNPWFTEGDPFDLALEHVREWHKEEMEHEYEDDW